MNAKKNSRIKISMTLKLFEFQEKFKIDTFLIKIIQFKKLDQ